MTRTEAAAVFETLKAVLTDAFTDTLHAVPFLLAIYVVFEFVEAMWQEKIVKTVTRTGKAGPVLAALGGSLPQCGFSVMISALYTQRLVGMGTIVATYLATSDEALPVMLSHPGSQRAVIALMACKIVLAVAGGYLVDAFMRRENARRRLECQDPDAADHRAEQVGEMNCSCSDTQVSCEYSHGGSLRWRSVVLSALRRTVEVAAFLLAASILIGGVVAWIGEEGLARLLLSHSLFQPVLTACIGLVPNCAVSVAIARFYLSGTLSFGSTVAGLGTAGGLGLLVLLKENHDRANTFKVIAWLLGISIVTGIILQVIVG
jgi:uncharacterized membrane protein YraQ (UPF0718 family)